MLKFGKWVAGHAVYWTAVVCSLAIVAGVFGGRISVDTAMALTLAVVTLLVADFRPRLERHQQEMRELLSAVARAGQAAATRNVPAAVAAGADAIQDGAKLAAEVEQEKSA